MLSKKLINFLKGKNVQFLVRCLLSVTALAMFSFLFFWFLRNTPPKSTEP